MNLDDENEVADFIAAHGTAQGRSLANKLGFKGKGATRRANDLSGYAWNKSTAMACRRRGDIQAAQIYETICERIYLHMDRRDRW